VKLIFSDHTWEDYLYWQKTIAAIIGGTIPAIIDIWPATSSC
jgi:hypothetical protein